MFKLLRHFASKRSSDPRAVALARLERGDAVGADAALSALLETNLPVADRAFLINKRGVARVRQGRTDDARADFEAALTLLPRHAPALANLGNLALEAGNLDDAVTRYEAAIAADDQYAVAYLNLGVAYKKLGRIDDAVRALRRAQRLEGRLPFTPSKQI